MRESAEQHLPPPPPFDKKKNSTRQCSNKAYLYTKDKSQVSNKSVLIVRSQCIKKAKF